MVVDLHHSAYDTWVENAGLPVYDGWGIHPPDLKLALGTSRAWTQQFFT